jgi:hypothetical protein
MTPTAPVQPHHHIGVARHKAWTTLLVLLAVAFACAAILSIIYRPPMTAAGIIALVALAVTVASLVWLHRQPSGRFGRAWARHKSSLPGARRAWCRWRSRMAGMGVRKDAIPPGGSLGGRRGRFPRAGRVLRPYPASRGRAFPPRGG